MSIFKLAGEVFWFLFGVALFWGAGLLGVFILGSVIGFIKDATGWLSGRVGLRLRIPEWLLYAVFTVALTGGTAALLARQGVTLREIVELYIPLDGRVSVNTALYGNGESLPNTLALEFVSNFSALFVSLLISFAYRIIRFFLIGGDQEEEGLARAVNMVCASFCAFCAMALNALYSYNVLYAFYRVTYQGLWSHVSFSVVGILIILVVGLLLCLIVGMNMIEVTQSGVFTVLFGAMLSRRFVTPAFSGMAQTGYLALLAALALLLGILRKKLKDHYVRGEDEESSYTPANYFWSTGFFGVGVIVCGVLSGAYMYYVK